MNARLKPKKEKILCARAECAAKGTKPCCGCQSVRYCSVICKWGDWKEHKSECCFFKARNFAAKKQFAEAAAHYDKTFKYFLAAKGVDDVTEVVSLSLAEAYRVSGDC
jgi:hypothetical protein